MLGRLRIGERLGLVVGLICLSSLVVPGMCAHGFSQTELLRYEVTWNGNKAGHGDITAKRDANQVKVTAQAVSDGVLKAIIELWSRVQATFSVKTLKPKWYNFALKSNLGGAEIVDVVFDHEAKLVNVKKAKGNERESHSEKLAGAYDPITAAYLLRSQKDLTKPMFVDIYDGKDRARLYVTPAGQGTVQIRTGSHQAFCLNLRLVKLRGDRGEIATGKLWISNDQYRLPLILTSSPLVGTIRFELIQAQL